MGRKRKKIDDYPDEWDIVEETQDRDDVPPPNETVAGSEIDSDTDALSQLAPEDLYRLKQTTKNTHSSVICKLTRIYHVPELIEEIKRICVVMRQVQLEGWHLANLHVLRCLKGDEDLPELNQMFFYRCCAASLANVAARDRRTSQPKHPCLHRTCLEYWSGRERVVSYAADSLVFGNGMINEMAKLMNIIAGNMITIHFRRRLRQYIRFRYAPEGTIELKYKDTKRIVGSCYRVKLVPELDEDEKLTGRMVKSRTTWDKTDDPVEKSLREWLEIVTWQWQIQNNSAHFVHKLHDMLSWMETFVNDHPTTRGARLYSLLPVATSYQATYVKLNATTLHGLFARILKEPKVKEFLNNELNIVPTVEQTSDSQRPFSRKTFQTHRSEILRKVFDVEGFETKNRKFVDEVETNSYGSSITIIRPLTTTSVFVVKKKASNKKRKKDDGTAVATAKEPKRKKAKTPEEIAEVDSFAKELFKLNPGYFPDVLMGIDPGMRSLVTVASVGRRREGHHPQRPQSKEKVTDISTRKYRHLARMNDFQFWNENLKKREPWYAGVIHAMPSFKAASYDTYFQRLRFFWMHLGFLLAFSAEQAFLQWRFTRDRAKMRAQDMLVKRIVPIASKQVCIAYGDWSWRDGIKGHATGPVNTIVVHPPKTLQ